jgi:hypothetical protein
MSDTENLNEAADSGLLQPRLVRLSRYQKMPDDGCGEWIGAPNSGGDVGDMLDIVGELNGLLIALHDAINRPKGVVPESADRFYQANARSDAPGEKD